MRILIRDIEGLLRADENPIHILKGEEMKDPGILKNAYLIINNGLIEDFGSMEALASDMSAEKVISARGRFVFPSFCDSHTHIVYAGSREKEFTEKIMGLSYEEIARRGGGILNSARRLHDTTEDELYEQALGRIKEITGLGTGAVEIKSGYGLNTRDELKMLRVIKRLKENTPLMIKSTFLGAHAIPEEYKNIREKYIELIISEMIPVIAAEELADFIDVFCDRGFFTPEETESILMAGMKYGLRAKLHANELDFSGGVQAGVKYNALSVDHLECTGDEEIRLLLDSDTMPSLLPGSAFFLGLNEPPARKMIGAGLPVALASDYNPGSSPSGNMKLVMSLACIRLKMLPAEAVNAATINGAYAMDISETHGSISRGKTANIFISSEIPSYEYFIYAYGSDLIDTIILKGKIIE